MHIARIDRELFTLIKAGKITNINIGVRFNTSMSGYSCGYFITILNDSKELLPMSLVLAGKIDDRGLQDVQTITISEDEGSMIFYDDRTIVEDLHVGMGDRSNLAELVLDRMIRFLDDNASKESFYPILSKSNILELNRKGEARSLGSEKIFLEKFNSFLNALKYGSLDKVPNIIGFGPGLTPSSDDFLLGLLSSFLYFGDSRSQTLKNYINIHKEKTTEVSKWMLHYAANQGLFPIIIRRFFQTEGKNMNKFLTHGGTSGIDVLCGIYTGVFLFMNDGKEANGE